MNEIFTYTAFSAFILFFFFGFLQLSQKERQSIKFYLSGLFFAAGYQFFYYWAYSSGQLGNFSFLLNTEIAVCFLIGPFFYLYFRTLTGITDKRTGISRMHFFACPVSLIIIIGLNLSEPAGSLKNSEIVLLFPDYCLNPAVRIINTLCDTSMAVYFILALIRSSTIFRSRRLTGEVKIILTFLLLIVINVVLLVVANIFNIRSLILINTIGFALIPMYYTFFSYRNPEICLKVMRETKNIRYEQSITRKLDLEKVETRLKELMEEEKIFIRNDLSVQSLSRMLKIQPYQLTRILNENIGMNFNTYVNAYRINEAKRLLKESTSKSILEIAFSVGFNSKSSFNTSFNRETGISPSSYRKKT